MNPLQFVDTIYLGDRGIIGITMNTVDAIIKLHIDCISRVRSANKQWDYYTKEDLEKGKIVFTECSYFSLTPSGYLPCDFIDIDNITNISENKYKIVFQTGAVDSAKKNIVPVKMEIVFNDMFLETADGIPIKN